MANEAGNYVEGAGESGVHEVAKEGLKRMPNHSVRSPRLQPPATARSHSVDRPFRAGHDSQLVEALRLRAPTAAEQLVATYCDRISRLAIRITHNGADAEEVFQDVFWTVLRKIDTFRGDSALGT
jgi:Sigma-70 region 2